MNRGSLPDTGGPFAVWLVAGMVCLVAGWVLLSRGRAGWRHGSTLVVLLVIGGGCLVAQPSPSQAIAGCEADDGPQRGGPAGALVIIQTSTIAGLAPSVSPAAIAGTVTNTSLDSTYVTNVTVRITSVTKATGSAAGVCSAADYVLADAQMPVDRALPKLSSVAFSGASLGFRNSSRNQDACKRATVHLGYVSDSR